VRLAAFALAWALSAGSETADQPQAHLTAKDSQPSEKFGAGIVLSSAISFERKKGDDNTLQMRFTLNDIANDALMVVRVDDGRLSAANTLSGAWGALFFRLTPTAIRFVDPDELAAELRIPATPQPARCLFTPASRDSLTNTYSFWCIADDENLRWKSTEGKIVREVVGAVVTKLGTRVDRFFSQRAAPGSGWAYAWLE